MLGVVFGLKHLAVDFSWGAIGALVAGAGFGWLFVRRQQRLASPFVDIGLLRSSLVAGSLLINLASFFMAFGTLLFLAQYLQIILGLGPFEAGLWTLFSAGFVGGSFLSRGWRTGCSQQAFWESDW
jgi:DHA2 family multidrug resistance protein-like MFS transporter